VDEVPILFAKEIARITGILVTPEETDIRWNLRTEKHCSDYASPRDYFLDGGVLSWDYAPKSRIPGQRWRIHISQTSHEISSVFQRVELFQEGYLTVEERLRRWGIVMHVASKITQFKCNYSGRLEEWQRVLFLLEIHDQNVQLMEEFTSQMRLLNPVHDLIPIRVLEVITVFRVLFRSSLRQFELEYADCVN
jgi:hypothetical protein